MPFPPSNSGAPPAPRVPTGKRRQNRYLIHYVLKEDSSLEGDNWYSEEVKSTSVSRAHTALVKLLNEGVAEAEQFRKTDVDMMSVQCLNPPRDVPEE